jgi:PAS domain S-box-containing protein
MQFYKEKFTKIIKETGIRKTFIQKKLSIAGSTLWYWENGMRVPTETNVRKLAKLFDINVNEISDLKEKELDDKKFDKITDNIKSNNWLEQTLASYDERSNKQNLFINQIKEVFTELSESKLIISALLNNMDIIFYIKDHKNQYITANNQFIETMKLNKNYNVNGKIDNDLMSVNDAKLNREEDNTLINNNKKAIYEGFIPNTRKKKWAIVIKSPILNEDGDVFGLAVTYTDITERKITEERVKILNNAINQSNTVISIAKFTQNKETQYLYLSDSVESIFGYSKENFTKDGDFFLNNCVHSDDYNMINNIRITNNYPETYEYRIVTKTKEVKWIKTRTTQIQYQNMQCILFIHIDATIEKNNREQAELLHFLINRIADIITIRDAVTKQILYFGKAVEKMTGYSNDKFNKKEGMVFWLNECVHPDDREKERQYSASGSYPKLSRLRLIKKNGETIWIERTMSKQTYNNRECFISVSRDITEIKKNEDLKALLEANINLMSDGLRISDAETGQILYVNKIIEEITGIPHHKLLKLKRTDSALQNIIHHDSLEDVNNFLNSEKRKIQFKIIVDSEIKWIVATRTIVNYLGKKCFLAIFRDITERKQTEEHLELLCSAIDQSENTVTWIMEGSYETHKKHLFLSDSVEKVYGYPKEYFLNDTTFLRKNCILPDDLPGLLAIHKKNKYPVVFKYRVRSKSGKLMWIETSANKTVYQNKEYVVIVDTDVTEKINLEQSKKEEKLNTARKLYKAGVAYDIISKVTGVSKEKLIN